MSNEAAAQVQVQVEVDYAPESFWLSKDAEIDWLDRNAFIERKDSGKATTAHSSSNNNNNFNPSVGSNRYSATSSASKSKPSIIGLPNYGGEPKNRKRHCKPPSIRLFPKRTESKSGGGMSEPSSPKVSCMGRVRSKKERSCSRSRKAKYNRNNNKVTAGGGGSVLVRNKSMNNNKDRKSKGFWNNLRSIFKPKPKTNTNDDDDDDVVVDSTVANNNNNNNNTEESNNNKDKKGMKKRGFDSSVANNDKESPNPCSSVGEGEAPGLGGVKRFASGRR